MELNHRASIAQNLLNLIKVENFQELGDKLIQAGVYSQVMLEEVLVGNGDPAAERQLAKRLFLNILTRGPNAFHHLVEALKSTDNKILANDLLLSSCVNENSEITRLSEDEVDSSNSIFLESPLVMLQTPIETQTLENIQPLIIPSSSAEVEIDENKVLSDLEIEELSGNRNSVSEHLQKRGNNYIVEPALKQYNGFINETECYSMTSRPRGLALIVNNIDFLGDPDAKRFGAKNDSDNLKSVLEQMGYEVTVKTNVTKKELLDRESGILAEFIERLSTKTVDSCIVSINSHGFDRDWIRMSDPPGRNQKSTAIDLVEDIFQRFNNRHFPLFQGKPKIFLINACRGSNLNRVVRRSVETGCRMQHDGLPNVRSGSEFSDFLILRSTVPEYVSMRDMDKGTWFIQCICKALSLHAAHQEFHGLKRKVNEFMEQLIDEDSRIKQSCHYEEFGTNKLLYFNPGI